MTSLPTLFLSHGAPDLPVRTGPVQDFLKTLRYQLPIPKSILVVSAHWNTPEPMVSGALQPKTIHDFSGFPAELYTLEYPAAGDPELAADVVDVLATAGFNGKIHPSRGLDHGAWTPLQLIYPDATVPVTQLSIQYHQTPEYHLNLGRALTPLRHQGVLIIGSGAATHNLSAFRDRYDAPPPAWVKEFDQWLAIAIEQGNEAALLRYRSEAPFAQENHPSEEHLLPLFVAMGAAGENYQAQQIHSSYTYGAFSMAAYAFGSPSEVLV